jgi:callose synthase
MHYFGRTLNHGGAMYRATGRGFSVKHISFAEIYRTYSRSHFVKSFEFIFLLILYRVWGEVGGYGLVTFAVWLMSVSWLLGPFIFNPSGFVWARYDRDFFWALDA